MFQPRLLPYIGQWCFLSVLVFFSASTTASAENNRSSGLIRAIREGKNKKAEDLIKRNKDINARDEYGWSPLMYAVFRKDIPLVEKLLTQGADINVQDDDGLTPLIAAIVQMPQPFMVQYLPSQEQGAKPIAMALIGKNADPNKSDGRGNPPLLYAVIDNQESIVQALLLKGADPNHPDSYGCTPMLYAGNPDVASKWVPMDGALNLKYRYRGTPSDESLYSTQYARQVTEARAQANVMLGQIKARIGEMLKRAGATAAGSPNIPDFGSQIVETRPRRLGSNDPFMEAIGMYMRSAHKDAAYNILVRVTADGRVRKAMVLSAPEGISERLQKAALRLRYQPAMKQGEAVEVWDQVVGGGRILVQR